MLGRIGSEGVREGFRAGTTFSTVSWCLLGTGSQPFHTELGFVNKVEKAVFGHCFDNPERIIADLGPTLLPRSSVDWYP